MRETKRLKYTINLYGKNYETFAESPQKAKNNVSFRIFGKYKHEEVRQMIATRGY